MTKKVVDLKNIYSLKDFINCDYHRKDISEWFKKKTHSSRTKDYKPDSEKWLKEKEIDEEISKIPDHNVNISYDDLIIEYGYKKVEFSIGTIKVEKTRYCYDYEEYITSEVTLNFLVENSYWGHGLMCTFNDLISNTKIQSLFEEMLDDQRTEEWKRRLESTENGVFMLLLNKIVESEKKLIECGIWGSYHNDDLWCQIGEEKYHLKDMLVINEAYHNNNYEFYDEHDRIIRYKSYTQECFPDFYLKHSNKK